MLTFLAKRSLSAALTLIVISILTFSIAHLAGDPAVAVAGKEATAADVKNIRQHYGFDRPVVIQYLDWSARALVGDFGTSYFYERSVSYMLATRLPITLGLGAAAFLFALLLSVPIGVLAAIRPGSVVDRLSALISAVGQAMPTFWLSLLLIVFFGVTLRWLPVSGNASWRNFVMPVISLGYFASPPIMRLTRAGMIEALESDYIRTARAKGLRHRTILFKHAFRNVVIQIVALSAIQLGGLLGGSIVVEQIFGLQGIGWLGYDATIRSDLPVVQSITLIIASIYVLLTLAADFIIAMLDPRIRVT